jgi:hypothetical protein
MGEDSDHAAGGYSHPAVYPGVAGGARAGAKEEDLVEAVEYFMIIVFDLKHVFISNKLILRDSTHHDKTS